MIRIRSPLTSASAAKIRRAWPVLLILVLGFSWVEAGSGNDPTSIPGEAKRAVFRARQMAAEDRAREGAEVLETYLREHPDGDNYLVRSALGTCLGQAGLREAAVTHLERAVVMNPRHVPAWIALGNLRYELKQYREAGDAFEAGYRAGSPPQTVILYYAGISNLLGERPGRSYDLLHELISTRSDTLAFDWYRALAAAAVEAGREKECWPVLRRMVAGDPGNLEAWHLLYQAAGSLQDYRRALVTLTVIDFLHPLDARELAHLGDLYLEEGVPVRAAYYYSKALEDSVSLEWRERLASAYLEAHESARALEYLSRAVRESPNPRLWSLLGDLHYQEGRYAESLAAFEEAATLDPERGRPHLMKGYCAYELDRPGEARKYLEEALRFPETRESAQRVLGALDGTGSR